MRYISFLATRHFLNALGGSENVKRYLETSGIHDKSNLLANHGGVTTEKLYISGSIVVCVDATKRRE